ncbi:MAG: DNA mismatch repair endonuclease MutL, partial [Verrucomicrobiae bacterium]|nr:DNA mismatch repair endonuclease MutL [Verrucomicrobiae bacterium]
MSRIRLLPEHVVNQIAAGEVVERPASVVKELVENSLDADAHRITVAVKNGGRTAIVVTDDGWGMSRDDALLALERHATSKISRAEDLQEIRTLGFRGEALPSIAAVSRFTLTTRERGALSGTQIEVSAGRIVAVRDVGAAEGTVVEVRNLFFNLPARRKFLRSPATETAHVEHIVTLCALAHPSVAFRLTVDEREVFQLAPVGELLPRLRELYGAGFCEQLLPVESHGVATVRGFIGRPGVSRADRSQQLVFVNGRPVESRTINHALREAYHTVLMRGQFPVTFLFLELDPSLVDVNVHPTKREVRFRDEMAVRAAVTEAVRSALQPKAVAVKPLPVSAAGANKPEATSGAILAAKPTGQATTPTAGGQEFSLLITELQTDEGAWRVIGVLGRLYVVVESPEGLVLVDQHAAHERVLFEKIMKQLADGCAPSQKLLLPQTLELEARDAAFLRTHLGTLQRLGIGISEFGQRTFLIDAVPPYFPLDNLLQTFRDIVDELRQTGEQIHARRLSEEKIATAVCRHAVKARDPLRGEELRALLEQLHRCDLPYTCPH